MDIGVLVRRLASTPVFSLCWRLDRYFPKKMLSGLFVLMGHIPGTR
jgi:hypothetical protein